jgi:hypothetical protein
MKKLRALLLITFNLSLITFVSAQTGHWTALSNTSTDECNGGLVLLTDGRVMVHTVAGGGNGTGWDILTPDTTGSYINGTWSTITPMTFDRLFFATQVLPSGKVYAAGGEYGAGGTEGEIYDPVANTWTTLSGVPNGWNIYDGNSEILYNGNVLQGVQIGTSSSYNNLLLDPATLTYTVAPNSLYNHDEAQWLKLRDSSILFVGIASDYSNRYIPQTNTWILDDTVPGNLYDPYGEEAGCAFVLPTGNSIFFGATPFNAFYAPTGNTNPGLWTAADSFPVIQGTYMGMPDAPGDMMVNGHILLACSPIGTSSDEFNYPCYFVEYDYTTNTFTQVKAPIPILGGDSLSAACYQTNFINLPDGTVLMTEYQQSYGNQFFVYTPGSGPIPQGKPTINNITETTCDTFRITGKLFNGISEGAAYGDDWQMETNYPIVRLTNGTRVWYAKTMNWNRIGAIQTDSLEDTAYYTLPLMPGGTYSLVVVANGFASNPTVVQVYGLTIGVRNISTCDTTGSATVVAKDGKTPYTYAWSPTGGTNATATGLSAGTYTVTVTDNAGCSISTSVTITQAPALSVIANPTPTTCYLGSNGTATASASGGAIPYTYSWTSGSTKITATGLSAGSYTITVHDSCGNSATASATVTQPNLVIAFVDTANNVLCHGYSTGTATASVLPGTPPYTYSWSGGGGTNATATGLSIGTYTVTVTDSCGYATTASVTITQPTPVVVIADSINVTASSDCDGEAWVTATGGTSPYTYLWTTNGQTTDSIKGQCQGTYCCIVTDNNGCEQVSCVKIGYPTGIMNIKSGSGQISIYPNPSNGQFTIQSSVNSGQSSVEIYNVLGQNVYSNSLNISQGSSLEINMNTRPAGLYLYRIIATNGSLISEGKIVIQK